MDSRSVRQGRKSPVRYNAEAFPKKDRSRSRPRIPKSPDKGNKKHGVSDTEVQKPRRRSPSRNAKSPTRSPSRRKLQEEKITQKKPSTLNSAETKKSTFEDAKRFSITPDRGSIEEVRSSVARFEEVLAEVVPTTKRRTKVYKEEIRTNELEQFTKFSENIEVMDKDKATKTTLNINNKSYNMNKNSREFGGLFGVLTLIFLLPLLAIVSQLLCSQGNCKPVPEKFIVSLKTFFDLNASICYIAFLALQFLLSSIPLGPKLTGIGTKGMDLLYRHNGPACLFLTVSLLIVARHFFSVNLTNILDKTLPLLVTAILCALFFTVLLYCIPVKESSLNPFANTNNIFYDMWMGRSINPRWGFFDIKISLLRSSLILVVIYNGLLVLKEIETRTDPSQYSVMLVAICTLQVLIALDPLMWESSLLSSFVVSQEGLGYNLIMTLAIMPFWLTLIPQYLFLHRPENNIWIVAITISLHFIGHILYRISCFQNNNFYRNPLSLKGSDVLFSRYSEKVFRGGLRARLRYPECSGLLLIIFSWCIGCLVVLPLHWLPISVLIVSWAAIIIHTRRLDSRSNIKHSHSWMMYISDASSALIPYIY